ncbi:MAG: AMP-binding protein, partial [Herbaspirillum sp.]
MNNSTAASNDQYQALYQNFRWQVPEQFNIAEVCCQRWAEDKTRIAILLEDEDGIETRLSYAELHQQANRLSNVLRKLGVARGDRIAIVLPQRLETAVAYMACFQLGAIAMPLSALFGPDALDYRLQNSAAIVAITDAASNDNLHQVRATCPALKHVLAIGTRTLDSHNWEDEMARASAKFTAEITRASDPAILIYTSGTTGAPKGALLPHSAIIGNLPGFVAS